MRSGNLDSLSGGRCKTASQIMDKRQNSVMKLGKRNRVGWAHALYTRMSQGHSSLRLAEKPGIQTESVGAPVTQSHSLAGTPAPPNTKLWEQ